MSDYFRPRINQDYWFLDEEDDICKKNFIADKDDMIRLEKQLCYASKESCEVMRTMSKVFR